jgi:ATP-binding cassette, subfamily B, multidrug efflux pump
MFQWFENLVQPFPEQELATPPKSFWAFIWSCTKGMRGYILFMTILTGMIGAFEALLFAMMGKVVDKLNEITAQTLWIDYKHELIVLSGILVFSTVVIWLQTLLKHQTLAGNFPMRMRWNFHRLMLGQSMSFYQDEFAGRVSAKVMQTALAVRDVWFIVSDIMVYVMIYFITIVSVVASFNILMIWPFLILLFL